MSDLHEADGMRVVVADDNEDAAHLLTTFLTASGYFVVATVHDGEAAVRETVRRSADLILLDINMPQKSGYEAAQEIRAASPSTLIVAVSGLPQRQSRAAFDDYILKPLDVERLRGIIKELRKLRSGRLS